MTNAEVKCDCAWAVERKALIDVLRADLAMADKRYAELLAADSALKWADNTGRYHAWQMQQMARTKAMREASS